MLLITLMIVRDWIHQPQTLDLFDSSWCTGIIIMMVAAVQLLKTYPDLAKFAWLWLAFDLFICFIVIIVVFARCCSVRRCPTVNDLRCSF